MTMPPQVKTILVPVDFSSGSDIAVEWAQVLAEAFGARLVLLHVLDTSASALIGGPGGVLAPPPPVALYDEMREEARSAMATLAQRVPEATTLIREGTPRQEILRAAADLGADLIVMGTHGRTGLAHLLFGSVAEHVVRHAPVPVFTIRQREAA
jgi:universal stress protein A